MRKKLFLIIISFVLTIAISCENDEEEQYGTVTFGANYHIVNSSIKVSVIVDRKILSSTLSSTNEINECGAEGNFTYDFEPGEHSYIVKIKKENGEPYMDDLTGTFNIEAEDCEKILIDFNNL